MKWSTIENCDIIKALNGYALHHVIKKIFDNLNLHDLQSATMSCKSWQLIIFDAGLWKQMFRKNVESLYCWKKAAEVIESVEWSGNLHLHSQATIENDKYFYEACMKIHTSLPILDRNWRKNSYSLQTLSFGEGRENDFDSKHVSVSSKWIFVTERTSKNKVQVWNRKINLLEKMLSPTEDVMLERRIPGVVSSSSAIIVAYPEDRVVLIWEHNTWKLVDKLKQIFHALLKNRKLAAVRESSRHLSKERNHDIDRDKYSILHPRMIVRDGSLLTCLTQSEEVHQFTVRKLSESDLKIQHQWSLFLNGTDQILLEFDMTTDHILVHVGPDNWDPDMIRDRWTAFTIQVRSNATFDLLRNVEYSRSSPINCFHHNTLCLIAVGKGNTVRIWDARTGFCRNIFRNSAVRVTSIQMVADKYIVTCDENGYLRVWDQQRILELDVEPDAGEMRGCLLWESSIITRLARGPIDLDDRLVLIADEFRIAVLLSNDRAHCTLHVMDFIRPRDVSESRNQESSDTVLSSARC